jgi:VWFA-related protein
MKAHAALGVVFAATAALLARQPEGSITREPVVLAVAVVDNNGHTVSGLERNAFSVKEDGRPVALTAFRPMSAGEAGVQRALVVMLDDANTAPQYTVNVQTIARAFLARANPPDFVSVTTFSQRGEELVASPEALTERVDKFRAGTKVLFGYDALAYSMRRMAALARELETTGEGRKTIVCVGQVGVFDMSEPVPSSGLWPAWVDLMHTVAQTRASVYVIDPTGLTARFRTQHTGLIYASGGAAFVNSNDFVGAVDRIWSEAGHYYALEYVPDGPERVLHAIDVSVRGRSGLRVHAVRYRGDYHTVER